MSFFKHQIPSPTLDNNHNSNSTPCPHVLRICLQTIESLTQHIALLTTCFETHRGDGLCSTADIHFHSTLGEIKSLANQVRAVQHEAQAALLPSGHDRVSCDLVNPDILLDQLGHLLELQKQCTQCAISCMKLLLPKHQQTTTSSEGGGRDLSAIMLSSIERLSETVMIASGTQQTETHQIESMSFSEDEAEEYVRRCREELRTTFHSNPPSALSITYIEYRHEVATAIQVILKSLDHVILSSLDIDEMCNALQQQSVGRDPRQPFFSFPPDVPYRIPITQWLLCLPAFTSRMLGHDDLRSLR
eukprot:PhF_6_TR36074/c0_g1_i1/m.52396